ncbi:T9SS type A sorting domain-containing protein [Hymenobacter sp. BT175]|nr:T9SS type A sorting domain-containing protein [Hymenobacter translucens]MCC2547461.1 T9SS type A sorting domain-containing protein [Hymenobacter translucens]
MPITATLAQRRLEKLNRGVVAVRTGPNVYVGWRLFGTDPAALAFNVYRGTTRINATPVTGATNLTDNTAVNEAYTVRPVLNGVEQAASEAAAVWAQPSLSIPIQAPAGGTTPDGVAYTYEANDASVGDLDGDGQYEIVLKWDPTNAKDNSQSGYTGNVYLDAYRLNGTRMWRIDLGRNIRAGAHYTQFMVYDLDSDGKAEVACKTADGTIDGRGVLIGSATADYRNSTGYVLSGPEFLTVFNGKTGAAMASTNYLPARGTVSSWGDSYGNRVDRFVAAVAYVDGVRPSLIMGRGYYTRLVRVAWDWRNGQLTPRWTFDSSTTGNSAYAGQGNHQMTVGDVDGDGFDEICNGASAIDHSGAGLYVNGSGHGDALHMSDLDPSRPGQEVWQAQEEPNKYGGFGLQFRDARTGQRIWGVQTTGDIGRALAADIDPTSPGVECWGTISTSTTPNNAGVYSCTGTRLSTSRPSVNFAAWWDGDLSRELLDGTSITKWNHTTSRTTSLLDGAALGAASNNTTKATPALSADLLGDWREEVIWRNTTNTQLMLFTTTIPTTERIYTLMHDAQYRLAIAWQNSAYNQPPHPSFFLGTGMSTPPRPNIVLADSLNNITLGTRNRASAPAIAVYPNPTSSTITIRAAGDFSYQIFNLAGQLVEQGERQRDAYPAGGQLRPGLYLVRVRTADGRQTAEKVLKQ